MKRLFLIQMTVVLAVGWSAAQAAESPWFTTDGAKIRLISLPAADGKSIQAGLQIDLKEGWKTYWRSPGASGLPPEIDFSGSRNIAAVKLDFPVPETFGDKQNLTAGYKKSVTFPISVEPLFANRATTLNASGILGICGEICLPVQFQLSLTEDGKGISSREIASELLFSQSNLMGAPSDSFSVKNVRLSGDELTVTANVPAGTRSSTLFVEGPNNWYLTPVEANGIDGTTARFTVSLRDVPKSAKPTETMLKFSLVADGVGVSQDLTPQ